MTILIIGGLLGLAVVAIIGAVLLGMSEERAERAQKATVPATALISAPHPQPVHARKLADGDGVTQQTPLPQAAPDQFRTTGQFAPHQENAWLSGLDGQVQEITSELRALALRAGELEQRLNNLSEALERHSMHQTIAPDHLYTPEPEARPVES